MDCWDLMDLIARYKVHSLNMKKEEFGKGVENLHRTQGIGEGVEMLPILCVKKTNLR